MPGPYYKAQGWEELTWGSAFIGVEGGELSLYRFTLSW